MDDPRRQLCSVPAEASGPAQLEVASLGACDGLVELVGLDPGALDDVLGQLAVVLAEYDVAVAGLPGHGALLPRMSAMMPAPLGGIIPSCAGQEGAGSVR
jgi:hypothetical protein